MATENILYTDGHDVTVTESALLVRKSQYRLAGITRHGFSIIKPNRILSLVLMGFGLTVFAVGLSRVVQADSTVSLFSLMIGVNELLMAGGFLLFLPGILMLIVQKEKYGVQIVTAEGEKQVLISDRREYISMIVEALNKAFIRMLQQSGKIETASSRKMSVSPR